MSIWKLQAYLLKEEVFAFLNLTFFLLAYRKCLTFLLQVRRNLTFPLVVNKTSPFLVMTGRRLQIKEPRRQWRGLIAAVPPASLLCDCDKRDEGQGGGGGIYR